jgi:hypothetical protein
VKSCSIAKLAQHYTTLYEVDIWTKVQHLIMALSPLQEFIIAAQGTRLILLDVVFLVEKITLENDIVSSDNPCKGKLCRATGHYFKGMLEAISAFIIQAVLDPCFEDLSSLIYDSQKRKKTLEATVRTFVWPRTLLLRRMSQPGP